MPLVATADDIARLFGRAAFGARPEDFDRWVGRPYASAVEHLLNPPDQRAIRLDNLERARLERGVSNRDLWAFQSWWLQRMRSTKTPLVERMTLLWHDHFATAASVGANRVTGPQVIRQNETLRTHALGNFRQLLAAITIDPAMLVWLDGEENALGHVNENYARELLELFTLGTMPRSYTETDVREAARVLTGWRVPDHNARFNAPRHDTGRKRVLGQWISNQGDREYLTLINVLLAQPAASRFVAWKLIAGLAYVPDEDLGARVDPLVTQVAVALVDHDWDLLPALRVLFNSSEFREGPGGGRQYVRQPIDSVVSAARAIPVPMEHEQVRFALYRMGQLPFRPPTVAGWPRGGDWLTSPAVLARYNWGLVAFHLANGKKADLPAAANLDGWARQLGLAGLSANTRAALRGFLDAAARVREADRQASVLALLLTSPDWMVI